jgi:hypothetical protein
LHVQTYRSASRHGFTGILRGLFLADFCSQQRDRRFEFF